MIATEGTMEVGNNQISSDVNIISTEYMINSNFENKAKNQVKINVDSDFTVPYFNYVYLESLVGDLTIPKARVNSSGVLLVEDNFIQRIILL